MIINLSNFGSSSEGGLTPGQEEKLNNAIERVELIYESNFIADVKNPDIALTFELIYALVQDNTKFVTLKSADIWWLLPSMDFGGDAIMFTSTDIISENAELYRVIINSNDEISDYFIPLENNNLKQDDLETETIGEFKCYPTVKAVKDAIKDVVGKIKQEEWVKFTANENSTISYTLDHKGYIAEADIEINKTGYSEDTEKWDGSTINLSSNESIYVRNLKPSTTQNYAGPQICLQFIITGNVAVNGKCSVLRDISQYSGGASLFQKCDISEMNDDFFDSETIGEYGCYSMFGQCAKLEKVPFLPYTELPRSAYGNMFGLCSKLKYIKCNATNLGPSAGTGTSANWLLRVSETGVFYKNPNIPMPERGTSTIPEGWVVKDWITDKTLEERVEDIESTAKPLIIHSTANTTAGGYQVPQLTADDITNAYNSVIVGKGVIVTDKDETMHAFVNQADTLNNEISIGILYYSYALLTYTLAGDNVTITVKNIS